ncbi:MAG TPA: D-2-hydroxyacid dehydrogenase family protein [Thermomicrobiales bacterium]|nr:D-2-hydroxyacid dehydrogenase family protein [Thermomicrobiales bacterium]
MNVTILDDYFNTLPSLPSFRKLAGFKVTVWNDHVQDTDALAERLKDTEILVLFRERTQITGALLDRLPRLKLISQRSVYPHVDVPACTRNGVLLCSNMHVGSPSYAAAELTFALMLASMRQLPAQVASLKAGNWQMGVGRTLRGRVLGLYGYGRIGQAVAGYGRAFGMDVRWWASNEGRQRACANGETVAASRAAFFAEADVVSLHVRLNPATRGLITLDDLLGMRADALLVNTSRSGLIEPGALLAALNAGQPGFAAVDVFDVEPLTDPADPLLSHPNVLATPHIGYVTEDELETQFSDIYDQILAFASGQPIHMINPEALYRTA